MSSLTNQAIAEDLQAIIQAALDTHDSHGIQLYIDSPQKNILWSGAVGYLGRGNKQHSDVISAANPVRIASVSKTFVATAILKLFEQHQLTLDQSIANYISRDHADLLKAGGYNIQAINLRHLLTHTSGLFDYADSKAFAQMLQQQPEKYWTRTELVKFAVDVGESYGDPGEIVRYSDTGYILLGEVIENITGVNLGVALRRLINYKKLGLQHTWLDFEEAPPENIPPITHQYFHDLDGEQVHPSFDIYGGGGLVSTVKDMATFIRCLLTGQIFDSPATLLLMLSSVAARQGGPNAYGQFQQVPGSYRLGIDAGQDGRIFKHAGFWGTMAAYVPEQDLAIGLSINRYGGELRQDLLAAILKRLGVAL